MQIRVNYPQYGILTSNNPVIQTRTNVVIPLPAGDGKLKDANEVISEQGRINNEELCYEKCYENVLAAHVIKSFVSFKT